VKWYAAAAAGALLAAALVYWLDYRDARPGRSAAPVAPDTAQDQAPALYRWRDDQGVLQITDRPPSGRPYERVRLREDQNVVPMAPPEPEPAPRR